MTVTPTVLIAAKQAENAQTTQYTSTGLTTTIDSFTVTNTTGGPVNFSCNLVTSGGSAGASNLIISVKAIQAGECYRCPELVGQTLLAGGFISTLASAATSLTIRASGRVFS